MEYVLFYIILNFLFGDSGILYQNFHSLLPIVLRPSHPLSEI